MIDLARGIGRYASAYHQGMPPVPQMGRELRGSTLGLIGYGQIARHLAPVATALGMRVLVSDPYVRVDAPRLEQVEFAALLQAADFVVCLAPATPATANLIDAGAFAAMKPGAYFINASRGELVDEQALSEALDTGRLAGCALDVGRAPDQMPTPALAAHPRVIATPHVGGLTLPAVEHRRSRRSISSPRCSPEACRAVPSTRRMPRGWRAGARQGPIPGRARDETRHTHRAAGRRVRLPHPHL